MPELLVATLSLVIVMAAGFFVLGVAVKNEPRVRERSAQIQQGRALIDRITREFRVGQSIEVATASQLSIIAYVRKTSCGGAPSSGTILCRITYSCGSTSCLRVERNPDDTGAASSVTAVSGITGPDVFTYSPANAPSYVGVRLVFPAASGDDAVTLQDGSALRNETEFGEAS